jgi:hypothetical protein
MASFFESIVLRVGISWPGEEGYCLLKLISYTQLTLFAIRMSLWTQSVRIVSYVSPQRSLRSTAMFLFLVFLKRSTPIMLCIFHSLWPQSAVFPGKECCWPRVVVEWRLIMRLLYKFAVLSCWYF